MVLSGEDSITLHPVGISDLMLLCALSTRLWWENACNMLVLDFPQHPPTPRSLRVTSAPAHARIPPLLSGVYKGICTAFYSIYAVLKCQMLPYLCFILTFIENPALRFNGRAWFIKEKPSVHCFPFLKTCFHAFFKFFISFRSPHKDNVSIPLENEQYQWVSCEMPWHLIDTPWSILIWCHFYKHSVDVLALLTRQNITLLYLSVDVGIVRYTVLHFRSCDWSTWLTLDTTMVIFFPVSLKHTETSQTVSSSQFCCATSISSA